MTAPRLTLLDEARKPVGLKVTAALQRVGDRLRGRWAGRERPISRAERERRKAEYAEEQAMYEAALSTQFPAATRRDASLKRETGY